MNDSETANVDHDGTSGRRRGSNDLYSPMRKAERKAEGDDTLACVKVKQSKPGEIDTNDGEKMDIDYESVDLRVTELLDSNLKIGEDHNMTTRIKHSELLSDDFRDIDSNSVLDFSARKRNLVLGIDRKPEIKPLSIFKTESNQIEKIEDASNKIEERVSHHDNFVDNVHSFLVIVSAL